MNKVIGKESHADSFLGCEKRITIDLLEKDVSVNSTS